MSSSLEQNIELVGLFVLGGGKRLNCFSEIKFKIRRMDTEHRMDFSKNMPPSLLTCSKSLHAGSTGLLAILIQTGPQLS
jgi:hypothetical protein